MGGTSTCAVSSTCDNTFSMPNFENDRIFLPVVGMGEHFFPIPPAAGDDYNCKEGMPLMQVIYSGGALTGFVFTHIADLPSSRYEKPHEILPAIPLIADKPPQCLLDLADQCILRTMHVWVDDFIVLCPISG